MREISVRFTMRINVLLGAALLTALLQFALHSSVIRSDSRIVGTLDRFRTTPESAPSSNATPVVDSRGGPRRPTTAPEERCAINLFGLPRAFQSLVLPSLLQNVIRPNIQHNCDYFVHYYNLTEEPAGRSGNGGSLDPSEILSLTQHVQQEALHAGHDRLPAVVFKADQEADFWTQYATLIEKTRTVKDSEGKYLYFPWKARTYTHPTTVDNILKMWHSIQSSWNLMDQYAVEYTIAYTRVAMLRSDVLYVTPIDIYRIDEHSAVDADNRYAVVPAFGRHPVSDRIMYGPYRAVQIWAAERFDRLESHVKSIYKRKPGWGMHSERFLNHTIFPAIRQAGFAIHEHAQMCFLRARVDESVWVSDCDGTETVAAPTVATRIGNNTKGLVEGLIGRRCGKIVKFTHSVRSLDCAS